MDPRGDNQWANFVSKDLDRDDYMLHPDIFVVLDVMWGPHSIDRFRSFHTRQIPRFCSRCASPPFSEASDTFTVSWSFCLFLGYRVSLSSLGKHPDPHIRQLSQALPHFFMLDLAPSTLKKYCGSFSKWQTWALYYLRAVLPSLLH